MDICNIVYHSSFYTLVPASKTVLLRVELITMVERITVMMLAHMRNSETADVTTGKLKLQIAVKSVAINILSSLFHLLLQCSTSVIGTLQPRQHVVLYPHKLVCVCVSVAIAIVELNRQPKFRLPAT